MHIHTLTLNPQHTVTAFLPDTLNPALPIWYTFLPDYQEGEMLASFLPENQALIVIHTQEHWEHVFSPWQAPHLSSKGQDFSGGASDYYQQLCHDFIPRIEQHFSLNAQVRGLLGYSLAGLFAVYGATLSPYFQYVASVSGSLWFDDWLAFVSQHRPPHLPHAIYFSVGDQEARTRQARMATVQTATEQTYAHWQQYGIPTTLEINAGGHFQDIPQRLAKAMQWLNAHRTPQPHSLND